MELPSIEKIKRVLLVGGTHGNESTGVFLIQKWRANPNLLTKSGTRPDSEAKPNDDASNNDDLIVDTLIANPEAIKRNCRYIDKDLNRCFSSSVLEDKELAGLEVERAHQLVAELGGKGDCRYDLIIDLHTSTANMKTNLVLTKSDAFHLTMMAYLQQKNDQVVVTSEAELVPDHHFLCALADHNVIVEVGPVSQGVLQHSAISATEQAVYQLLDFVKLWNQQQLPELNDSVEVLSYTGKLYFPEDEAGNISGYLHHSVDGSDYCLLNTGDDLFVMADNDVITYKGKPCYISFVNEAAYYDQKIALCTLEKKFLSISNTAT